MINPINWAYDKLDDAAAWLAQVWEGTLPDDWLESAEPAISNQSSGRVPSQT